MDITKKKILLVEDKTIIALSERFMLTENGYSVKIADCGEAAIEFLENDYIPDLILMDINLGSGIDGPLAASRILERWRLPIVFLTSHSSKEMVEKVQGITRYGYIIKNSGDFVILSTIEMALELFRKDQALEEKERLLRRAEKALRLGYWSVEPETSTIILSEGSRELLGIECESCPFEVFQSFILKESSESRDKAFCSLIEDAEPYDITYKIHRPGNNAVITLRSSGRMYNNTAIGVLQDISGIERSLDNLREIKEWQAVTLRSIGDGVISTDITGRIVELNRVAEHLTGWSSAEAHGRQISEVFVIVNAITRKQAENPVQKVIDNGCVIGLANHTLLIARDGTERHIADSAAPIQYDKGSLLGMVLVFRDISEEYKLQEEQRRNAEMFRTLFMDSPTPMLVINPETGAIHKANKASELFYGWKVDELRVMNISRINTLSPEELSEKMNIAVTQGQTEFRFIHKLSNGDTRHVLDISGPIYVDGKRCLLSIIHDITETHNTEATLLAAHQRSETLRLDAYHRMKNNVQMISSLIRLQMEEIQDKNTKAALCKLQNRIASMSLAYDQLYKNDDLEIISTTPYLLSLIEALKASYLPPPVTFKAAIEDIAVESRFAVSLGLIVCELVMNSCKYAFPFGQNGTIDIELRTLEKSGLSLVVSDDGIGMQTSPDNAQQSRQKGIGLALVTNLTEQEGGTIHINTNNNGTTIRISFPTPNI